MVPLETVRKLSASLLGLLLRNLTVAGVVEKQLPRVLQLQLLPSIEAMHMRCVHAIAWLRGPFRVLGLDDPVGVKTRFLDDLGVDVGMCFAKHWTLTLTLIRAWTIG